MAEAKTFMVEDAQILFRNFAGKEGQYNLEGQRNFSVVLDPEMAARLAADGWNVKERPPREEGDDPLMFLTVAVNFKNRPPNVVMISSAGHTQLSEDIIETLDYAEFKNVDLICRGYDWDVNGKSGTKAYLKSLFVTIEEDALERKYAAQEAAE